MYYFLGLIGHPTAHSLSPYMHKAALQHFGLAGDYQLFDIAPNNSQSASDKPPVEDAVKRIIASALNKSDTLCGLNVTVPHKEIALQFADKLTAEAKLVNAINCLKISEETQGQIIGHNTDLEGFTKSVQEAFPGSPNQAACVLGTGGAAKAAVIGLTRLGYKQIAIVFRNRHKATTVRSYFSKLYPSVKFQMIDCQDLIPLKNCDLLVNATTIGLNNLPPPDWAASFFERLPVQTFFYDMVYHKDGHSTALMQLAHDKNLSTLDGKDMLINQAIASFSFWTNLTCPKEVMQDALVRALG
jgi:shikimate dehydrogenase